MKNPADTSAGSLIPTLFSYAVYKNSTQPSTRYSLKFCKNKSAASYIFFILLVRKASLKQITHAVVVFPSVLYRVVAPQFFSLRTCGLLPHKRLQKLYARSFRLAVMIPVQIHKMVRRFDSGILQAILVDRIIVLLLHPAKHPVKCQSANRRKLRPLL